MVPPIGTQKLSSNNYAGIAASVSEPHRSRTRRLDLNQEDFPKKKTEKDQHPGKSGIHPKPKDLPRWQGHPLLGFEPQSEVLKNLAPGQIHGVGGSGGAGAQGRANLKGRCVVLHGSEVFEVWAKQNLAPWMIEANRSRRNEITYWALESGPFWVLYFAPPLPQQGGTQGDLTVSGEPNLYAQARDLGAHLASALQEHRVSELTIDWKATQQDLREGFWIGLELGCYRFKGVFQGPRPTLPKLINVFSDDLKQAVNPKQQNIGVAVNLARHLVNLPPNLLNPESYAELITKLFAHHPKVSVEVWTGERLKKERCHLLREVGAASQYEPALVHIRYRPDSTKPHGSKDHSHRKGTESEGADHPIVFVGKGITFDSGGLDIKDGASMRIMKKDMGGSASALAIAWWVQEAALPVACDFYLALAENAIGSKAFRPGDVVLSRAGVSVEIDNTDAEGRLVMADAIDVALEQNPHPKFLVNLSTLTGAMRVALGTRIGGYFTNQNSLVSRFEESAHKRGELVWRMPLHGEYRGHLKSSFADIANSGPQRFGGAISAAMFLHRFAGRVPWIHVDHYSWTDGPAAGCLEPGGTGQMVQLFADLLDQM